MQVMFLPLAIAIPSLAFAQGKLSSTTILPFPKLYLNYFSVSGINPRVIGLIVTVVCVFYTAAVRNLTKITNQTGLNLT